VKDLFRQSWITTPVYVKQPISISRQHQQHPTIPIEHNISQQSSFLQLGPRTSSTDSESEHNLEPLIKQLETQQQAFE